LSAFEAQEKEAEEKQKAWHEFETFLMDTREKISTDAIMLDVSTHDERMDALRVIANIQYLSQRGGIPTDEELQKMRYEVETATAYLIKRADDRRNAPENYKKIETLLNKITKAVQTEWPSMGVKPSSAQLKELGRACHRTEKWLKTHEDLEDVTKEDLDLVYERLRKVFDSVKGKLRKSKSAGTEL
jgi:hypothetical protein